MRKRLLYLLPLIVIAAALCYMGTLAPIITGYAAKNLASGIFVAGRSQKSIENEDLNFSFVKYNKNKVDFEKKEVTSRFLFWKSKALFIQGFGCILVRDFSPETIKSIQFRVVPLPDADPDTIPWPAGDRLADTIPPGIDIVKLNRVIDKALSDTIPMKGTFAVAVAYKNHLVAEHYRSGFLSEYRYLSWSMAKSFTNALTGILVRQGKMDLNKPADIAQWKNDNRKNITLENLLQMSSGLEWNEDYGNNSDVNKMLFKKGDMGEFAMSKKAVAPPDSIWLYSSGTANIICKLIRKTIGSDTGYYAFPYRELFNKTGMRSAIFETDASGTFIGSSYIYASMRDYVRFGLLYLNNGNWQGEQLFPENWLEFTTTPAKGSKGGYGAHFWLNRNNSYPGVPADMFSCQGHDGQMIYIIPSKKLVVVRTGFSKAGEFDFNKFLSGIVETVE